MNAEATVTVPDEGPTIEYDEIETGALIVFQRTFEPVDVRIWFAVPDEPHTSTILRVPRLPFSVRLPIFPYVPTLSLFESVSPYSNGVSALVE